MDLPNLLPTPMCPSEQLEKMTQDAVTRISNDVHCQFARKITDRIDDFFVTVDRWNADHALFPPKED